jgi:hypothetical protein
MLKLLGLVVSFNYQYHLFLVLFEYFCMLNGLIYYGNALPFPHNRRIGKGS